MGCGISGEGEHARAVSPSVPPFLPSLLASLPPSAASTSTSISTSSCARARARAHTHTHTRTHAHTHTQVMDKAPALSCLHLATRSLLLLYSSLLPVLGLI